VPISKDETDFDGKISYLRVVLKFLEPIKGIGDSDVFNQRDSYQSLD
jgi:hypothetical protein